MVIQNKPATVPDKQSKKRYPFNRLRRISLCQILSRVREDRTIGLEDLAAFLQLLDAGFGDHHIVATAEWEMQEITQMNRQFSQYYAECQVVGANLDWDPST
jgi:hypothetical protein